MPANVSPEEFVRLWQAAASLEELIEQTGLTIGRARDRARYYRSRGVPLKELWRAEPGARRGRKPLDVEALTDIAEKTLKRAG